MIWTKVFGEIGKGDALSAGGKGASLGEMTQAGIPIPQGFVLLSSAFEHFLKATDLNVEIESILKTVDTEAMHTVENASAKIQELILSKEIPEDIYSQVLENYRILGAEFVAQEVLTNLSLPLLGVIAFSIFALIEEAVKFIAAYVIIHRRPEFDEPVDAMIYTVVAALGFATVENIGVATSFPVGDQSILLANIFQIVTFRFVGATLLHALASGIIGYHWALGIARFGHVRLQLLKGLLAATVLHGAFNYIIFKYGDIAFAVVFLLAAGLFVLGDFEKLKHKPV